MVIFGFLPQNWKTQAVAVAFSIAWPGGTVEPGPGEDQARDRLAGFRRELYGCLTARADELFELAGAVLWDGDAILEDRRSHGGRLHYVGHLDGVKGALTVRENLAFSASIHGRVHDDRAVEAAAGLGGSS